MPLAALRGLVVLAFVVPVSLGVLARSADANSFDAALRDASVAVVKAVDGTIGSAAWVLSYPSEQTAATSDSGVWDWFMSLFGGGEETQAILVEETPVLPETPVPTSLPATPASAPRSLPPISTSRLPERVIERTVVQPTYTTVVLPDPALEKRVSDLEQRPISSGGATIAIPVFNHEEGNDNTFTGSAINTPTINGGTIVNLSGLSAADATITAATTTSLYATLARFAEGVITSLSATVANITTLVATSATLGNATSTNATTTNLYVSGQTTIGALSGFLKATAGVVSTALVNLASDVTGILPVSAGGTGWAALASGFIPFGNGSSALATSSALSFDGTKLLATFASSTALSTSGSTYLATAGGSVGIGTTTPNLGLTVTSDNGNGWAATFASSGTAPKVIIGTRLGVPSVSGLLANGSNYTNITFNPEGVGSVGIGTTTFMNTQGLYVNESGFFAGGSEDPGGSNPSPGTYVGFSRAGGYGFVQAKKTGVASYNLILNPAAGGGNIGIGTTTPNGKVSIYGTDQALTVDGSGSPQIVLRDSGVDRGYIGDGPGSVASGPVGGLGISAIGDLAFGTGGTIAERMRITSAGNLGIGTTTPSQKVSVAGNIAQWGGAFRAYYSAGSGIYSEIYTNSSGYLVMNGWAHIDLQTGSVSRLYINGNTGNVSIPGSLTSNSILQSGDTLHFGGLSAYPNTLCYSNFNTVVSGYVTVGYCSSDARLKHDITYLSGTSGLDAVLQLKPAEYVWNGATTTSAGFIAQDVQLAIPEAVHTVQGSEHLAFESNAVLSYAVKAIQEIAAVSGVFRDNLVGWLADAGNGIASVVAGTLKAKDLLCVGNTCITEAELINLLEQSNQAPVPPAPTPEPPPEEPPAEEPAPEGGEPPVENPEAL